MNFLKESKISDYFVFFVVVFLFVALISFAFDKQRTDDKIKQLEDDKTALIYENKELKKKENYLSDTYDDWKESIGEKMGNGPIFDLQGIDGVKGTTILTVKDAKYGGEYIIITNSDRSFMQITERKKIEG